MSNHKASKLVTAAKVAAVVLAIFAGTRIIGIIGSCGIPGCGVSGDSFDDRMSALSRTDPKLVKYQELRRIKLGLDKPTAITIGDDGRLYVSGTRAVEVYDRLNGTRVGGFALVGTPRALASCPGGGIYAAMGDHVEVHDASGKLRSRWGSLGPKAVITSIAATKSDVWVADAGNRVVVRYNPSGQVVALIGKKDPAKRSPGIIVPSPHMDAAAAGGGVWISNPGRWELELYTADGTMTRSWGKQSFAIDGFSGCCNPTDFAILPGGKFVTSEKGLPRVKVYGADGKFEGVVAGGETFKPNVVGLDLAADPQGRIFVMDPASMSVRVYVPKGKAN